MDLRDPNESGAILGFMRKHGVRLKKAEETIEAIHLPPQQARTLSVPEGIPALYIERRCLNEQEQPADFTKYWIPAGTWKYHASITL